MYALKNTKVNTSQKTELPMHGKLIIKYTDEISL